MSKKRTSFALKTELYEDIRSFIKTSRKYSTISSFVSLAAAEKLDKEIEF